jgi:hypothetical protein
VVGPNRGKAWLAKQNGGHLEWDDRRSCVDLLSSHPARSHGGNNCSKCRICLDAAGTAPAASLFVSGNSDKLSLLESCSLVARYAIEDLFLSAKELLISAIVAVMVINEIAFVEIGDNG